MARRRKDNGTVMRDMNLLHPDLIKKINELLILLEKEGLSIKITDTLRTKEEQDALYAQGRTIKGNIVTNVKYPNSMHNWGVAFDFCRNDGKGLYDNSDRFFDKVGKCAEKIGLEWGGSWTSIVDKPHIQLSDFGSTPKKLLSMYFSPENFLNSSCTTTRIKRMSTIKNGSKGDSVKILQVLLGLEADGIFGTKTNEAVVKFQRQEGLEVDGIVGRNTWARLFKRAGEVYE